MARRSIYLETIYNHVGKGTYYHIGNRSEDHIGDRNHEQVGKRRYGRIEISFTPGPLNNVSTRSSWSQKHLLRNVVIGTQHARFNTFSCTAKSLF